MSVVLFLCYNVVFFQFVSILTCIVGDSWARSTRDIDYIYTLTSTL